MSKVHKVFVYGTLRPSKEATHILPDYDMFAYNGGKFDFPYIVEHDWEYQYESGQSAVMGNVIEVDDKELKALDKYEGVDRGLYKRVKVDVWTEQKRPGAKNGHYSYGYKTEGVWVYVAGPSLVNPDVPSGDWFNR